MDRATASSQLRALGLTVTNGGIVKHSDYDYGVLTAKDMQTVDGRFIPLSSIDYFSWVEANNDLFAHDANGGEDRIHADHFSEQDTAVISMRQMPRTISELSAVFEELYPDAEGRIYYDELNEYNVVDLSLFGVEGGGFTAMTDAAFAFYLTDIQNRLKEHGFIGKGFPSERICEQALAMYMFRHSRNSFREWVEAHEWDGVPRVRTWFQRLFGATAPALREMGQEERYLGDVAEMWFVGIVRRQYEATKHEIVPVMISSDQGIGKGNAIQFMAGRDEWYVEATQSLKNRDKFLDSIRGAIIVELSESKQIKDDDNNLLKAFISVISDRSRKPYAKYSEIYPRRFGLIASSNEMDIFNDVTGNRRYFPIVCEAENSERVTKYDVEQVWAEALQMYRDDHLWFTTEESADIAAVMQEFSAEEDINVDAIDQWLDDPDNGYTKVGARISRGEILDKVFSIDPMSTHSIVPWSYQEMYKRWARRTRSWAKLPQPVYVNGRSCRVWERTSAPGTKKKITRLKTFTTGVDEDDSIEDVMRRHCLKHHCMQCGDLFPKDELTSKQIDLLMREGYIYESAIVDGESILKVGVVP